MITRIKMNILLFVFLVIFEIVISGTTKQAEAQETIIIGSARTPTIEVNMEALTPVSYTHLTLPTTPYV